jgi:serine/threonine protein kinase/Tol biopolymer transport system component
LPLQPGTRLGPYEVLAALGAGGMGEVYRARDTRLERTVAIKVLPETLKTDPQFRERFDREARVVAALNHPHICSIHDVGEERGTAYLVMELLAGETLATRLERGALPLEDALQIAEDVASGLDAAHRAGIVHRDLKPDNIMLTKSGAKLLDFGLAKTAAPAVSASNFSMVPTTPVAAITAQGTILGTFQYMAPEQLEGHEADVRTDIFAFGTVFYEMLTGKKAFEGKSQASLIGAIMHATPPPIAAVQPLAPPSLDRLVKTCLAKDPDDRWQSARDLLRDLKWIAEGGRQPAPPAPGVTRRVWSGRAAAAVAAGIVVAVGVGWAAWALKPEPTLPIRRLAIDLPDGAQLNVSAPRTILALSPDGARLAFVANGQLYVKTMDQLGATAIAGTVNVTSPFFSPDSRWLGFTENNRIRKVAVTGGAPLDVCENVGGPSGATWATAETILFGRGSDGIWQVPASGGTPSRVIAVDPKKDLAFGPQMLPGGKAILFTLASQATSSQQNMMDNATIVVQLLDSGERTVVVQGGSDARYVPTGHILYVRQRTLFAIPFDPVRRTVQGSSVPLVDGIAFGGGGVTFGGQVSASQYAVSAAGLLMYVPEDTAGSARTLVWVDRQGHETPLPAPSRAYAYPRISPDGSRVALDIRDQEQDIWTWDVARETLSRFTFDPAADTQPVWTPDGKRIVWSRTGQGLLWQAADGSGTADRLTESGPDVNTPSTFSRDGAYLLFTDTSSRGFDIKMLRLNDKHQTALLADPMTRTLNPEVSPDGRWLAYESIQSGQTEVFVRPFPDVQGGRWQISRSGGTRPLWAKDGHELYFMAGTAINSAGEPVITVTVETASNFRAGNPTQLFPGPYFSGLAGRTYDISADGQRFLMIKTVGQVASTSRIIVVENWFEELKRRVPPAR